MIKNARLALLVTHVFWQFDPDTRDVLEYTKDLQHWTPAVAPYKLEGPDYKVPIATTSDRKFFRVNRWWGFPLIESSIWTNEIPAGTPAPDAPVELGVKFQAAADGFISGIRFHKDFQNTGPHVGNLWDNAGNLLATGTFENETVGWQEMRFATPIPITQGLYYVASYHCLNGFYSFDANYFLAPYYNLPLAAGHSVYSYGAASSFPDQTSHAFNNYWVDVVYYPR